MAFDNSAAWRGFSIAVGVLVAVVVVGIVNRLVTKVI